MQWKNDFKNLAQGYIHQQAPAPIQYGPPYSGPTLVLWAQNSDHTGQVPGNEEMRKSFVDYVKDYKFEMLDDVSHYLIQEKPDLVASKINKFVHETSSDLEGEENKNIGESSIEQLQSSHALFN